MKIIVPARPADKRTKITAKYEGHSCEIAAMCEALNTRPNAVWATLEPDPNKLSPLARFLAENCGGSVYGKQTKMFGGEFYVYNGKTRGDTFREERAKILSEKYSDADENFREKFNAHTENIISFYCYDSEKFHTDGWLFPVCQPDYTDEEYFECAAADIIAAGATKIRMTDRQPCKPARTVWLQITPEIEITNKEE